MLELSMIKEVPWMILKISVSMILFAVVALVFIAYFDYKENGNCLQTKKELSFMLTDVVSDAKKDLYKQARLSGFTDDQINYFSSYIKSVWYRFKNWKK